MIGGKMSIENKTPLQKENAPQERAQLRADGECPSPSDLNFRRLEMPSEKGNKLDVPLKRHAPAFQLNRDLHFKGTGRIRFKSLCKPVPPPRAN